MADDFDWRAELHANFPGHPGFSLASFISRLHEANVWDEETFWKLDRALREGCEAMAGESLPRAYAGPLFKVYSHAMDRLAEHRDQSLDYLIAGLPSNEDFYDWRERFQLTVEGFYKGEILGDEFFALQNPLLAK